MKSNDTRNRSHSRLLSLLAVICPLLCVSEFSAGQVTDASIVGQARDESGAVLPGVTVTAASPALQVGSMSTVTDARGEYRLTPLRIGTYSV